MSDSDRRFREQLREPASPTTIDLGLYLRFPNLNSVRSLLGMTAAIAECRQIAETEGYGIDFLQQAYGLGHEVVKAALDGWEPAVPSISERVRASIQDELPIDWS